MNLTIPNPRAAARTSGFTLVEALVVSGTLVILCGSMIMCNLYGLSMSVRQQIWLSCSDDAAKALGKMMTDIRAGASNTVGNGNLSGFTPAAIGGWQQGNALMIYQANTNGITNGWWVMYYYDPASSNLFRTNYNGTNSGSLDLVTANMREIGAPAYTEEELAFAREVGASVPREQKIARLRTGALPDSEDLADVDLNRRIYDPYAAERKGGASSDVAEVAWNLPTVEFSTTAFVTGVPGHSWQHAACAGTSIGRKSTLFASRVMAGTVLDLLTQPELTAKAWEEWRCRMKGRQYKSPLPMDLKPPLDQLPSQ